MNSPVPQAGRAPATTADVIALIDDALTVARTANRADLVQRLDIARDRVRDPRRRIVVVGPVKQGKSQFVNALLNLTVCRVGDDETTAVPTVVRHATTASAELVFAEAPGGGPSRVSLPLDQLTDRNHATRDGRDVLRLEVNVASPLLADGLVVVDTPGVGGHRNPHAAGVLGMVEAADAVLVLSDASTELTEPEVAFVRQVVGLCPAVAVLVSKIDLYPEWRRIADVDRGHLQRNGIDVPVIAVSSMLRSHALRLQDAELNTESGFDDLYAFLRSNVVARSDETNRAAVASDVRATTEHIALALASELAALRDPETAAAAVRELQRAKQSAEDLHKRTSLWQQSLGDGIADLAADIDHDLRERLRQVTRDAETWIDARDPGDDWADLGDWLEDVVGNAIGDNFVWAHERSLWLAQVVAQHFAESGDVDLPDLSFADLDAVLDPVDSLADLESGRIGITQKMLVGMRGSYGGVLMFGMVTTLAGMALINPISIGAGVLLGSKAFREDKQARVARRQAEAKQAVRRYVEDVSFRANKESKDRLRLVQRTLRDHFAAVADSTVRSLNDSLRAAQDAASVASTDRAQRAAVIEQQMRSVAAVRSRSDQLIPASTARLPR